MELSPLAQAELRALVNRHDVSARIATRARIVLWAAEGRMKKDIAMLAGVSRPTVDFWIDRYGFGGVAALTIGLAGLHGNRSRQRFEDGSWH